MNSLLVKAKHIFASKKAPFGFYGGLQLKPNKRALHSATKQIAELTPPSELVIPLLNYQKQSIAAQVVVNEKVTRGQLLAAGVIAPASGRVKVIEPRDMIHPGGLWANAIVIEVDGTLESDPAHSHTLSDKDTPNTERHDNAHTQLAAFLEQPEKVLHRSALLGLGGAGFPTAQKLRRAAKGVNTLIINGAECEPEIACDEALMHSDAHDIALGINALAQLTQCDSCILAIEDSKPIAIESMSQALTHVSSVAKLIVIPTRYPTGAESPLIQTLTKQFIPHTEKPADHGIVCVNVATAYALWQAIKGHPLDSRVVSLGGSAMPSPCNVRVRFGTSVSHVLRATGNASVINTARVRAGGPLSGFDLDSLEAPVTAQTNALLAEPHTTEVPAQQCIRCGDCADVCPAKLLPQQLHWYAMADDTDKCQQLNLNACIECGCCDLVCPSSIKLTQSFRYAKSQYKHLELQQQKALEAEQRFNQHEIRVDMRKREKERAIEQRKQSLKARKKPQTDQIKAAIERARSSVKPNKQ